MKVEQMTVDGTCNLFDMHKLLCFYYLIFFVYVCTELRVVIGILLVSGYSGTYAFRNMWSMDNDLKNEMVYNSMRRNRFQSLLSML